MFWFLYQLRRGEEKEERERDIEVDRSVDGSDPPFIQSPRNVSSRTLSLNSRVLNNFYIPYPD